MKYIKHFEDQFWQCASMCWNIFTSWDRQKQRAPVNWILGSVIIFRVICVMCIRKGVIFVGWWYLQFSMHGGKGWRAYDIHRDPGPSLTPVYNLSHGIWCTSNLGFFPTQKEVRKPFHFVAWHLDPILKKVARETKETLIIKFSEPSQESFSCRSWLQG